MSDICLMTKSWRSSAGWTSQLIAQAIAERGATITFIAPQAEPETREPKHANLTRVMPPRELVAEPSKVKRAVGSLRRIAASLLSVARERRRTGSFIFSIPEPLLFSLPMFVLLRMSGAKVVFIVHDAEPHAWALGPRLRFIEKFAHALSYRLASRLITLTPTVGDALKSVFDIPTAKISIIPHGPLAVDGVCPMPGNGRLLIFGSLRRNKSVLEVIRGVVLARKDGHRVSLVLAGEPLKQEAGYWEECLVAIADDPSGFDVREGFLPDDDLPDLISSVDAFVLAYQNFNSQSGVAVLAAFSGRPVIGSRSGGLGELYSQGMAGEILDATITPESVAHGIATYCGRGVDHWRNAVEVAAIAVAGHLRWDAIADQYIEVARSARFDGRQVRNLP